MLRSTAPLLHHHRQECRRFESLEVAGIAFFTGFVCVERCLLFLHVQFAPLLLRALSPTTW